MDTNSLLNLAMDVGEIMLRSGAETNRVEDTIERILSVGENNCPQAFVASTGMFATVNCTLEGSRTMLKRISSRSVNLEKMALANALSRDFVEGKITIEEAFNRVEEINSLRKRPYPIILLSYGIVSLAFTFMFLGSIYDGLAAFIVGIFTGITVLFLTKRNVSGFLTNIFGGGIIAIITIILITLGLGNDYSKIIIGSLMPLVPGVAITNAIRDIMAGDFISGSARVVEAIVVAVGIASGVGIVLQFANIFWGGI